jgi:oligoribonuclease NrnB/cAMP/cGMP phosphodiesterase (DHH superfamily)
MIYLKKEELKEMLERSQNPLILYDNDADGLCAFLLLRRALQGGKGIAIRSYPSLDKSYANRAKEFNSDSVIVLDKPVLSDDFILAVKELGLPLIWVDHHDMPSPEIDYENFICYNPLHSKKKNEPTSAIIYDVFGNKSDVWIAVAGCIADHYLPNFISEFKKKNKEMWNANVKVPFDAYYKSEIGKIAQAFNFGLKDSAGNIVKMQNFLIKCKNPGEVFAEVKENEGFRHNYNIIRKKYDLILEKALENIDKKYIWFEYSGDLSISSDISNELSYRNPGKYIFVVFRKGNLCNLSIRGKNVRKILKKIIRKFEFANGGGHDDAVGARIRKEDLERFKMLFLEEIA